MTDPEPVSQPGQPDEPESEPVDRAETLGFARHLPGDIEAMVTFHRAEEKIAQMRQMDLWSAIEAVDPTSPFRAPRMDDDLDGMLDEPDDAPLTPMDLFGTEVTVALGAGGGQRLGAWLDFSRRADYHQMRRVASELADPDIDQDMHMPPGMMGGIGIYTTVFSALTSPDIYEDLMNDPVATGALNEFHIPAIYFAVRPPDGRLEEAAEMLSQSLGFMTFFGEMVAPVEMEHEGTPFTGYRIIGADMVPLMEEDREFMEETMGKEATDMIIDFLRTRELVAVSGVVDDYAVIFIGPSTDEMVFAASPDEAVTAGDKLAFADPLLAHPFLGLMFAEEALSTTMGGSGGSLSHMAKGLRDGFAANDPDGSSRDLVALLDLVSNRAQALQALTSHADTGITIVEDQGLRIEGHGGSSGMLDFSAPSHLAALGDEPDVAMFLNFHTDSTYRDRSTAYYEALFETAYAMARRFMDEPADGDELAYDPMAMPREYFSTFDTMFREDVIGLWRATAHDMTQGLGGEAAYVVDLGGTLPVIPDVPEILIEHVKAPRVTMLAPVADRGRLAAAWEKMHESGSRLVPNIAEMWGAELAMPRPIRSETNGLTSWFLPLPYFDDDFLPSVTLDDDWFAMGTSRNRSIELLGQAGSLEPREGYALHMHVNFGAIAESQRKQIDILDEHRDAILESEEIDDEDYEEMRAFAETIIDAMEKLENLEIRCWDDDGLARWLIHLRTAAVE